jgi:YfiH family protein
MNADSAPGGLELIEPDWPAPARVRACVTTRVGGVSSPPYAELNLASHVGDSPAAVAANRQRLARHLALPEEPRWLEQVHGVQIAMAGDVHRGATAADGVCAHTARQVCVVLTADCLPVLMCSRDASVVVAAHAGWRGLASGVLEAAVEATNLAGDRLMAWLGPAIGPRAFEVGDEVRAAFVAHERAATSAFVASGSDRWMADLYALARQRLARCGVSAVYGGHWCTYSDAARFYSYRRDGATGRMAALIWLE